MSAKLKFEEFHVLNDFYCCVDGYYFSCKFFYKNDIKPIKRTNIGTFNIIIDGLLKIEDDNWLDGFLVFNSIIEDFDMIDQSKIKEFKAKEISLIKNFEKIGDSTKRSIFSIREGMTYKYLHIKVDGKIYTSYIIYKSDVNELDEKLINFSDIKNMNMYCKGKMIIDGKQRNIRCLTSFERSIENYSGEVFDLLVPLYNHSSLMRHLTQSQITEVSKFLTIYPDYKTKLTIPEKRELSADIISDVSIPEYLEPYKATVLQLFDGCKEELLLENLVRFWNDYSYKRMKEIMENSARYDRDSISSCVYMSMRIIKEFPYKFNWELVSSNRGITNRDILSNPEWPWDENCIREYHNLPRGFYEYKRFKVEDEPENVEYSKIDILLSPDEPPFYPVKVGNNINVSKDDIEEAIKLLKIEDPDYFENNNVRFHSLIEEEIIKNIRENGTFIMDEFCFPEEPCDNEFLGKTKEKFIIPEPTEDDPYSVRNDIEYLKLNHDDHSEHAMHYKKAIIPPFGCKIYIKNRKEYETLLSSQTSALHAAEKCIFFEVTDPINYPGAFYRHYSIGSIIGNSGKLTLEFILANPTLGWNANDIAGYLPIEWVIKNLIFFRDRIKLPFLSDNIFPLDASIESICESITKIEKDLIVLLSRLDVNKIVDFLYQYPELNINPANSFSINKESEQMTQYRNRFEKKKRTNFFSNIEETEEDLTLNMISWKQLKIRHIYEKVLNEYSVDSKKFSNCDDDQVIGNLIKVNKELIFELADIIPLEVVLKNPRTKWIAPQNISINNVYDSWVEFFGSNCGFFSLLAIFDSNISNKFIKTFEEIINSKYKSSDNKSDVYNFLVESLPFINKIITLTNKEREYFRLFDRRLDLLKLSKCFKIEDVAQSKYADFGIIISGIIGNLED